MPPRNETELLNAVIDLASLNRWSVHHDRPARRAGNRWYTAIQGHAGFPDLCLARRGVVLFRELKSDRGRMSSEQRDWAVQLNPPHLAYDPKADRRTLPFDVWYPSDWDLIVEILTAREQHRRSA